MVGYFDAPADKPAVFEFVEYIDLGKDLSSSLTVSPGRNAITMKGGADKWEGPGLAVQWVEIEGPLNDTWPPAGPS